MDKSHFRIEAYGDVDELSAHLGVVAGFLENDGRQDIQKQIQTIQGHLFVIGGHLATTSDSTAVSHLPVLGEEPARFLENAVDRMTEALPRLTGFILPGGTMGAGFAHVARCVCRRAERRLTAMAAQTEPSGLGAEFPHIMIYMNRLSDYLFVLARTINHLDKKEDIPWKP